MVGGLLKVSFARRFQLSSANVCPSCGLRGRIHSLPVYSLPMQAGAIASFLRELLLSNCARADLVQQDFQECVNMHFQLMPKLTPPEPGQSAAVAGQQGQQQ